MSIPISIPTLFKMESGGRSTITMEASVIPTVRTMLDELFRLHPALRGKMVDGLGEMQRHVNIFVNGLDVRFIEGLDTPLSEGDEVQIVPMIAGGKVDAG